MFENPYGDPYTGLKKLPENLSGWHGNDDLFARLIDEVVPTLVIEVGSWYGQSTITMAKHLKARHGSAKLIAVDTWLGAIEFIGAGGERDLLLKNGYPQAYYQFLSNVLHNAVQDVVIPFPQTSLIAARYFAQKQLQPELVYIDASHEYEDVKADLEAYWPLVRKGGVMFGDDFDTNWPGVMQAVKEFAAQKNLDYTIEGSTPFWVIRKKGELAESG